MSIQWHQFIKVTILSLFIELANGRFGLGFGHIFYPHETFIDMNL